MKRHQIYEKIIIKLVQCILQSRIQVQKQQIKHFNQLRLVKKKYQIHETNLSKYLDQLLLVDKYNIRKMITKGKNFQQIFLIIKLVQKSTGICIKSEVWLIEFVQKETMVEEDDEQQYQIITALFQQILFFLNKQPLFLKYHRNSILKKQYMLDYFLRIGKPNIKQKIFKYRENLMELPYKYTKQRVCRAFDVNIQCYYLPKLEEIFDKENKGNNQQQYEEESKNNSSTIESSSKEVILVNQKSRKISIYQYYDKQLDFIFLSSDDQTFKNSPKNEIKEVDLILTEDNQQNFELLIINKDNQFLDSNHNLFCQFSSFQKLYLNN